MHVLGHPNLPLIPEQYPENSQILNCWNFCLLLEYLKIPYCYYGLKGSKLPPKSSFGHLAECGLSTGNWQYQNRWHKIYTKRLNRLLKKNIHSDGRPEWISSLYGIAQSNIDVPRNIPIIEPLVGYNHCWANYRVFPSYAQQHVIYTSESDFTAQTRCFDAVISHFLDPSQYHTCLSPKKYLLYLGRNATDKGIQIAETCAKACNRELKIINNGCYGKAKATLLSEAYAVLMPTLYVEPFGYVAIEAQLSGTPVISTDWGAFTETVLQDITGFRCRTFTEFCDAVTLCKNLDRTEISKIAKKRFTVQAIAEKYSQYFSLVWKIHKSEGYYTNTEKLKRSTFLEQNYLNSSKENQ